MTRTRNLRHLWPVPLGLALACVALAGCGDPAPPPNLILITLDTVRSDRLGTYGYDRKTTPTLDALAARGIRFDDAIAQSTTTPPSHASILTGLNPARHGLRRLHGQRLPEANLTLAEILRDAGYSTAAFLSALPLKRFAGLDQGFDFYDDDLSASPLGRERAAKATNKKIFHWLDDLPDPPIFLWVHYFDAHYPYFPPVEYQRRFGVKKALRNYLPMPSDDNPETRKPGKIRERNPNVVRKMSNLYDGEIAYMDAALGALLEGLANAGVLENAAVAIIADHGELLGEQGYFYGHWGVMEEVVRVPMILLHPEGRFSGQHVARSVGTIDLVPTLLAWLGVEAPVRFDGIDLTPLLEGKELPPRAIYSEQFEFFPVRTVRDGDWMLRQRAKRKEKISLAETILYQRQPNGEAPVRRDDEPEVKERLAAQMNELIHPADAHATDKRKVTDEVREQLRALGYTNEARGPD